MSPSPSAIVKNVESVENPFVGQPHTLESHVREFFTDIPVLAEIARCESHFRHFDSNCKILKGRADRRDIGLMQINEYFHGKQAGKLGFDIYTLDGNIAYAKWLYEKEGVDPWRNSQKCWTDVKKELAK